MNRRQFLSTTTAAGVAAGTSLEAQAPKTSTRALMKLGCQRGPTTEKRLDYWKRYSVTHVCGYAEEDPQRGYPTVEQLTQLRERCEKHGIVLDMIAPSFLESSHIDREKRPSIMLGQSPERDRDIERIQNLIRNCAKAGVPAIKYNMSLLGVIRTPRTPGRGG